MVFLFNRFLMTITHDRERVAFFNTPKREVSEVRGRPNLVFFKLYLHWRFGDRGFLSLPYSLLA
jgi:hypothetical protein